MTSDALSPTTADGPAGPELDRVRHAFFTARAVQEDPRGAEDPLVARVSPDGRTEAAGDTPAEAAPRGQPPQEGPGRRSGPAREWAAGAAEALRSSGQGVFEHPLRFAVREGVLLVLGIAAGLSALFVASDVLSLLLGTGSRKGLTAGLAVAPLLLSAVLVALIRVHAWASPRFAFP